MNHKHHIPSGGGLQVQGTQHNTPTPGMKLLTLGLRGTIER